MKKYLLIFLTTIIVFIGGQALAEESQAVTFSEPVLITSIGQNPDALMVKVLLTKNKIQFGYSALAAVEDLSEYKTVIMVVGASTKGLGAAGIDFETELERTQALVAAAVDKEISIIFAHVGGKSRRGAKSDQLIDLVSAEASYMIITEDGNTDGRLTTISEERNIPLKTAKKVISTGVYFKEIFSK